MSQQDNKALFQDALSKVSNSPFNRSRYSVNIHLHEFFHQLSMFTHGDEKIEGAEVLKSAPSRIFEAVPEFQRDNDKWSQDMQVKFVENVVLGHKSALMFYEINQEDGLALRTNCQILDGLQRLTALSEFMADKFKVLGFYYSEMVDNRFLRKTRPSIIFEALSFDTEIEAVDFYIAINEGVTHSPNDIKRAYEYREKLLAHLNKN